MTSKHKIFGVPIDADFLGPKEMAQSLFEKKDGANRVEFFTIASLNPEILLKAQKDPFFKEILGAFDTRIVDGFGIQLVLWLKGKGTVPRIAGSDLSEELLKIAIQKRTKVGIISRKDGLSGRGDIENFFRKKGLEFEVFEKDLLEDDANFIANNLERLKQIEIFFIFLGAPAQEKLLNIMKREISGPKIGICAGGTIDFWTGNQKRAPKFFRKIGMEWLWRLALQRVPMPFASQPNIYFSKRIAKFGKSVLVFPLKALLER